MSFFVKFYSSHHFQWIRLLIILHTFIAATSAVEGMKNRTDILHNVNRTILFCLCVCVCVCVSACVCVFVYIPYKCLYWWALLVAIKVVILVSIKFGDLTFNRAFKNIGRIYFGGGQNLIGKDCLWLKY